MEFAFRLGDYNGVSNDLRSSPLNEFTAVAKIGGGSTSYSRCSYCHSRNDGGSCSVCHYI